MTSSIDVAATGVSIGNLKTTGSSMTTAQTFYSGTAAQISGIQLQGSFVVSTAPGTIQLQWAQSVATAVNTIINDYSICMAYPVF